MSESKRGGVMQPIQKTVLIPQIAALLVLGKSTAQIAQQLNVGFNTVKKLATLDETKALVKEAGDSAMDVAKACIKNAIRESVELANEVLLEHLREERSLDAVKLVYKVAGALSDEPVKQNQGNGNLTVVLPGGVVTQNEVIDVTSNSSQEVDVGPGEEASGDQR